MKIVVAPDSFKGNLSAVQAADFIEKGISMADATIEVRKIPVADGGEGTVEALVAATSGRIVNTSVHGPLMDEIQSYFGILGDGSTAVIEMAAAAGLNLVPQILRNPLNTTTYGVGELILKALEWSCNSIIIGLGGSSTNDGGMGMAQALGIKFYGKDSELLGQGGKYLDQVCSINVDGLDNRLKAVKIVAACDVTNPLYGPKGATYIYGPQKGADEVMLGALDKGMKNYAERIKESINRDVSSIPGSGAAGGLGGGLLAFLPVEMKPGIDIVIEHSNFEETVKDADLLITGEGRTDLQTAYGKVPVGLAAIASKHGIPVVCLSGGLGEGYEAVYQHGIDSAFSCITGPMTLEEAMERSGEMLTQAAYAITRLVMHFKKGYNIPRLDI